MLARLLAPRTLLDPRGRCSRIGLLRVTLVLLVIEVLVGLALVVTGWRFDGPLAFVVKALLLWIAVAVSAKRLHDIGLSAWWIAAAALAVMAWCFVVTVGLVVVAGPVALDIDSPWLAVVLTAVMLPVLAMALWLHCAPGCADANAHGPVPAAEGFSLPGALAGDSGLRAGLLAG